MSPSFVGSEFIHCVPACCKRGLKRLASGRASGHKNFTPNPSTPAIRENGQNINSVCICCDYIMTSYQERKHLDTAYEIIEIAALPDTFTECFIKT